MALLTGASAAVLGLGVAHPASAGLPQPPNIFNAPLRLPGALGSTNPSLAIDSSGTAYVAAAEGPNLGCTLDTYSADGGTARYLGRPAGGTGCALSSEAAQQGAPATLSSIADGPSAVIFSRSTNSGKNFSSQQLPGATSLGPATMAADPQLGLNGQPTVFALVRATSTGLPALATSIDGGLSYSVAGSPLMPADLAPGTLQGAAPVTGNLVARRDDTGLKLYTVVATADSATDQTALDTIYEAIGTVTPSLTAGTPPTVAWHDVLVYQAVGVQLNRPAPTTAVDSAGHVYAAFSDARHVYAKADPDGTTWSASAAPISVDTTSGIPGGLSSAVLPVLVAGGNGLVDLAWFGATTGTGPADQRNNWNVYLAQSADSGAAWTAYSVTSSAIHQGALCVAGDAACAAAQQSPPDPSVAPGLQLALNPVDGAAVLAYGDDSAIAGLPALQATRQCGGLSATTGKPLTDTCAAPQQSPVAPAGSTCPGPQITDLPGDAIDTTAAGTGANVLNLDITQEVLNQVQSGDLVAAITVQYLSLDPGGAAISSESWALYWTYNNVRYYAAATIAHGTPPTYLVGTLNSDGTPAPGHAVTGTLVPGGGGNIVMTIPAALVGGPALGATLQREYAASYATYATGAPSNGQVLVDRAPDAAYGAPADLGVCPPASDIPEAPMAILLPAGAAAGGAILFARRRKRSRASVKEGDEGGIPAGIAGNPVNSETSV